MPKFRRWGGSSTMERPPTRMSPAVGCSKPATMSRVVVLPEPLGPRSVRNSPCLSVNVTSLTTSGPPYDFETEIMSRSYWLPAVRAATGGAVRDARDALSGPIKKSPTAVPPPPPTRGRASGGGARWRSERGRRAWPGPRAARPRPRSWVIAHTEYR